MTCWDFYWNHSESIDQVQKNWHLDNIESYPLTWKIHPCISFIKDLWLSCKRSNPSADTATAPHKPPSPRAQQPQQQKLLMQRLGGGGGGGRLLLECWLLSPEGVTQLWPWAGVDLPVPPISQNQDGPWLLAVVFWRLNKIPVQWLGECLTHGRHSKNSYN